MGITKYSENLAEYCVSNCLEDHPVTQKTVSMFENLDLLTK